MRTKRLLFLLLLIVALAVPAIPLTALGTTSNQPAYNKAPIATDLQSTHMATAVPGRDFLLPVSQIASVPDGYTGIYTKAQLSAMRDNLNGSYILMNDIVFSPEDFQSGGAFYNGGQGWQPIGNYDSETPFTGILNGNGYSIVGLTTNIYLTATSETWISAGLFSYMKGLVQDLSMIDANIRLEVVPVKYIYVGAIAGVANGNIHNCVVTGTVSTPNHFAQSGGIAGENDNNLSYCKNYAVVSCGNEAGGIVGDNAGPVANCVNLGNVTATYSNGAAGGIVGRNNSSITACFNVGIITGADSAAGISPDNFSPGAITNCFNTGQIKSTGSISYAAGITTYNTGSVATCYSNAKVINAGSYQYLAGVVYLNSGGAVTNSYYNSDLPSKGGGTPLTTTQMKNQASFAGFDFTSVWNMNITIRRPILKAIYPDIYNISYIQNGGSIAVDDPTGYMRGSNNLLPVPVRSGYTYLGWFKDAGFATSAGTTIPQTSTGTYTVYAKWGVPIQTVKSYNYNSIKITWSAAGNATSYKIYRATSADGSYYRVYVAPSTARSWVDTGLVTGKYYYYKVCPEVNGKSYYHTANKYAKPVPAAPTVTLSKYSSTSIKVAWTGVAGATKYQIFRASSATGTYTYQYTASSTTRSWVNTGRTPGKYYYYKVRAYHLEGTTKVYGYSSAVKYIKM